MDNEKSLKIVDGKVYPLEEVFNSKYTVDFYQREYVWQKKQIEDLITDLSNEFLKQWKENHTTRDVQMYDPYYMGEIVLSTTAEKRNSVIDGQQRITTLTLLLIYLINTYGDKRGFPDLKRLVYIDDYGEMSFNLDIEERNTCMQALFENGDYIPSENDKISVKNIVDRYHDIAECWNGRIDETNIACFAYWLKGKVLFSRVWTNSDEFAYVIFETMNDRGLTLTQVEMLRSYLLANIDDNKREKAMKKYDGVISVLSSIKSKAEFEFFKIYFRGHYAETLSQTADSNSDFIRIGQQFHRWVRENQTLLGLNTSSDYIDFIDRIEYFANIYATIMNLIDNRKENVSEFLYLIVNNDYSFTLQPALILAAIAYNDGIDVVYEKIRVVSKYLTKILSWRIWNHMSTAQSAMEDKIYKLCKEIRGKNIQEIKNHLASEPIEIPNLDTPPSLNQTNRVKVKVLLSLITEIVARESGESDYMLNKKDIEVEHIWADHYELFREKENFTSENEFSSYRNNIGDLLVLPKSFNASYGDMIYEEKVELYFSQNILAQSLCEKKYLNSPGFMEFLRRSGLDIHAYSHFTRDSISERAELYKNILLWNWK